MRFSKRFPKSKKNTESPDNHERWLLTYADMITLLLGLFIILYSISKVDEKKLENVAEAIRVGFGFGTSVKMAIFEGDPNLIDDELFTPRSPVYRLWEKLGYNLKRWKESTQLKLGLAETEELNLTIFAPTTYDGDWIVDETQDATYKNLAMLTQAMDIEIFVRLEIPQFTDGGRTSWEDSAKRTAKLAQLLETKYNIPREKIAILAHTKFSPLPTGSTAIPEARAKQERIEFTIRKRKRD
jgi:chemotaxis protein MotB